MSDEYWRVAVEEALGVAGVEASENQVAEIASWMQSAHECHSEATGLDVVTSNFNADQQRKIDNLENQLAREKESIPCPACAGKTIVGIGGQVRPARYECWHCDQTGKVQP